MKQERIIRIITIGAAALICFGVFWYSQKPTTTPIPPPDGNNIILPENVFDASITIPGTAVTLSYPSKGFYELGADITTRKPDASQGFLGGYHIATSKSYESEKGSEYITLNFGVSTNDNNKTLRDVVSTLKEQSIGKITEGYVEKGTFETIGSHEYFLYKMTEDVTTWDAVSVGTDGIVTMNILYHGSEGDESSAAYIHNDEVFRQILERLKF